MGYFDRILGKGKKKEEAAAELAHEEPASLPSASPEIVHEATSSSSSSSYGPPSLNSSSLGANPAMTGAMQGLSMDVGAGAGTKLYDPYDGISQAVGTKRQAFRLPQQPEFLFEEEAAVRRRGWGENLQFYTGLGYITGAGSGVAAGGYRFLTTKPTFQGPETMKLKANRMLNSVGMYARPLANGCGIVGLYYATADSFIYSKLDQNGLPDSLSSVLAGAVTGALFRSPRGPRQALVAGAVGAVAGTGLLAVRKVFPSL